MADSGVSLDELIDRVLAGDGVACETLVERTCHHVRGALAVHINDRTEIDDLAQEVYVHVLGRLGQYRRGTDFPAWLRTVARFQALAWRRRQQRRHVAHRRYLIEAQARLGSLADQLPDQLTDQVDDLTNRLRRCLESLSSAAQQLVKLHYFEGLQVPDLAMQLSRSPNGIHVSLTRVRKALASCLESQVPNGDHVDSQVMR